MTYIHWMKRNGTEKEPCWATLWPSSRLYNVGLQKFGFHQLKYHLIICVCMWVSVQCTNWKGNRCEQKKKIYWSFCPIYHIFRYCSLLLWMMCGCLSIPFFAHCMWFVCVGRWIRLPVLSWDFFFYSIVDVVVPERKMMYKKTHAHILPLYIWSMSVFMFRLNCSTFKLNSRNEWGNSKSGKCW